MPIDREATLKNAEKFLRVGRLDAAIAEYARVVDEYPRDWTTANTLGDLYLRAAQSQKAVALYQRIADHLLTEGFYPKAAALLKKILKITPDDEAAQIHLAEISARQGLLADARAYYAAVAGRRRQRGDAAGADEIVVRLGALDPADAAARLAAAQAHERRGDTAAAARIYRELYDDHLEKGRREEALDALRACVRCAPDTREPELLLPLAGLHLEAGDFDAARGLLSEHLAQGPAGRDAVVALAWRALEKSPEAAAVCVDALAGTFVAAGDFAEAAAILQEFATRVPGQVSALLRLVEVCVDGGLEATMYEAQAQLADAYLASGRPDEARVIAEDLVTREPGEPAHLDRLRRALQMLGVADVEAVIADRLAGAALEEPEPLEALPAASTAPEEPFGSARAAASDAAAIGDDPGGRERAAEPQKDERRGEAVVPQAHVEMPQADTASRPGAAEIDLTALLEELEGSFTPPVPQAMPAPRDLEDVFAGLRAGAAHQEGGDDSGDHFDLARTYVELGMTEEAIGPLEVAARSPRYRFAAAALLARIVRDRGDLQRAIEWYERAAQAPAPAVDEGRALLYELGEALELLGEHARALAVFIELDADAPGYRDVGARVARLSNVEAGG
ncbi:MAG TPA: tetratricopeptide repeat protein [Vicinamibacterales bacterium]|nr:tetratricopeptide repeat protein [Vicinamibacterales bacterium]